MKRNRLFNKIISLSLIFALYFSMSASAFAELETDTESVNNETVSEEVKVEESAAEMHSDELTEANEVATGNESVDNQQNMNADKQNQTASEPSNEGGVIEQVITPIVEEIKEAVNEIIGDETNSEESEEDQLEPEEDKALEEEEKTEFEHELSYTSNNDGTHTVTCENLEEGEEFEEYTESCEFDEEGVCKKCGYHRLPDPILTYEDDEVIVKVSGAIPDKADLKVTPIKADVEETAEAFNEVIEKLEEKSKSIEKDYIGFLAYDICFVDIESGQEKEPDGDVTVSLEYKQAINPVDEDVISTSKSIDVELMHIKAETSELENLSAAGNADIALNSDVAVTQASFTNDNFSTYVITWSGESNKQVTVNFQYKNLDGMELTPTEEMPHSTTVDQNSPKTVIEELAAKPVEGYIFDKATYKKDSNSEEIEIKSWKPRKSGGGFLSQTHYYLDLYNEGDTPVINNIEFARNTSITVNLYYQEVGAKLEVKKVATGNASKNQAAEYVFTLTDKNGNAQGNIEYKVNDDIRTTSADGEFVLHTGETAKFLELNPGEYTITEERITNSSYKFKDFTTEVFKGDEIVKTYAYSSSDKRSIDVSITDESLEKIKFKNCETILTEEQHMATVSKFVEDIKDKDGKSQDKYSLTFKFKGPTKTVTPYINEEENEVYIEKLYADIIVVIDKSGSMDFDVEGTGKTRVQLLKEAVDNMVDVVAEKENENGDIDLRWEVIDFATYAAVRSGGWVTTDSVKQYVTTSISSSNDIGIGTGTNYEAGLTKAQTEFTNKQEDPNRPNAKKIVIFLTDGEPTICGVNRIQGQGAHITKTVENASYAAAGNLQTDYFYGIGIGLGECQYYEEVSHWWGTTYRETKESIHGEDIIKNLVSHSPAPEGHKSASNIAITDVSHTLEGLAGVITSIHSGSVVPGEPENYYANNVVMYDTISDNVEFTKDSIFYINVTKDGKSLTNDPNYWTDGHINSDGIVVDDATYILPDGSGVTFTATIEGDVVKMVFPKDYQLDKGYVYSVKFKVEPSDKAYAYYYNNNSYPDVGDDKTDHYNNGIDEEGEEGDDTEETESNKISTFMPGFYTNGEARTTYSFDGKDGLYLDFPKPVVPVHLKNVWEIYKTDGDGKAGVRLDGAQFLLKEAGDNPQSAYLGESKGNEEGKITWDLKEDKAVTVEKTYMLTEVSAPTGYAKSGEYWEIALDADNKPTVTAYTPQGEATECESEVVRNKNVITYKFYYKNLLQAIELPNTGGTGTDNTNAIGFTFIMLSTYLFYKNKKRQKMA